LRCRDPVALTLAFASASALASLSLLLLLLLLHYIAENPQRAHLIDYPHIHTASQYSLDPLPLL
jgi:hypothetical protein